MRGDGGDRTAQEKSTGEPWIRNCWGFTDDGGIKREIL